MTDSIKLIPDPAGGWAYEVHDPHSGNIQWGIGFLTKWGARRAAQSHLKNERKKT